MNGILTLESPKKIEYKEPLSDYILGKQDENRHHMAQIMRNNDLIEARIRLEKNKFDRSEY